MIVILLVLAVVAHRRTGRRLADGLRRREEFRSEHEGVAGWLVDLIVLQGAAPTGRDVGVVWFDGDRLYFLGSRTSFGLARSQVKALRFDDWLPNDLHPPLTMALNAATPVGSLGLGFEVLPQPPGQFRASRTAAALNDSIRGWMASSQDGEGQLPPVALGPEAPTSLSLLRKAVQNTIFWCVVTVFVLWTAAETQWWYAPVWAIIILLLSIPWGGVWIPRLRWRAWRDRRRLDRSASQ